MTNFSQKEPDKMVLAFERSEVISRLEFRGDVWIRRETYIGIFWNKFSEMNLYEYFKEKDIWYLRFGSDWRVIPIPELEIKYQELKISVAKGAIAS